jgi:hypothetical protein
MGVASGPAETIYVFGGMSRPATTKAASLVSGSFTTPDHHPPPGQVGCGGWTAMQQFDREYCHDVKSACLQAIANTSFCERSDPLEIIPAAEVNAALIDIMGTITAMVEASLPNDLQVWAEELAAKFATSFHAARASLTTEELRLLEEARA